MPKRCAVLDASVLVSAFLTDGPPRQLLRLARAEAFTLCVSGRLLEEVGRSLAKPKLQARYRYGAVAVMESRIVPLLPYGLVNYSAGLTRLGFREMAVGTLIGAPPKVFAYVALGGSLTDLGSPEAIVAIVLLVTLALVGALFVRRQIALGRA